MKSTAPAKPIGVSGQEAEFGDYSRAEVESLRVSLAKIAFPAPEGTVARMLPRPVKPLPVEFVDWMPDRQKKGRVGGNVVEYWLNSDRVLQVATAYYAESEKHFSLEEWAVILTAAERDGYDRRVY